MRSLPLTLVARILPVAVLAVAGVAMTTPGSGDSDDTRPQAADASSTPSAADPTEDGSGIAPDGGGGGASTAGRFSKPPAQACNALPAAQVKKLVPGAKTSGNELKSSDLNRRSGCSWHALDGFDYRWLDISFDVTGRAPAGSGDPVSGLGDKATVSDKLTSDDDQQVREAVVTVRKDNATIVATYNGGDFESHKAPSSKVVRDGAISAAKNALSALDE
ncbi:conserved hypothetical protein [Streptomyces himastatinicus ATCC 53653]|uniref:Secreted protein n=1 Tax=Streptomyces himastatinicus ATCC 53653 TaxID=457427 RepID=D9W720_9ACTN|nr:hypothetical protein [Streptomyces himastatinicus]EFL26631.1 conserved hypothetical protein [Streptomyces himastatinicus ATCC 53653]